MSVKAAATQVAKKIDWEVIAKLVATDEGKRELTSLKRTYDEVNQTLESKMNAKELSIDWGFYKERLNPGIVDIFEKSYKSLNIPDYVDKITPEFEKKHKEMVARATEAENFSKKELVRLGEELEQSKAQREALRTQTVDDYFEKNPEVKKQIDEELAQQNWGY